MAYQYGGWYDNPATGKNQRWFNGVWTDGSEPGGGGSSGGSSSGGGVQSTDDILNSAISSLSRLFPTKVKPYDEVNPFSFDERLAREASTAEYSPYYQEMLQDYTTGTTRTLQRSQQDLTTTLDQLNKGREYYTGTQRRLLENSLRKTNEGWAGNGLFFSGARERDIKDINTEYQAGMQNYDNQYNYNTNRANELAKRTTEDTNLAQSQYTRDTNRAQQTAIEQGVLQRETEARNQYEIARKKYYDSAMYNMG